MADGRRGDDANGRNTIRQNYERYVYPLLRGGLLRSGCAWRMLPREFPPWQTVYYHFRQCHRLGTLRRAHDLLRGKIRAREGRDEQPSAAVIDSQAAKTTGVGGPERGYDGAKRLAGRRRGCPLGSASSIPPACCLSPKSTARTCTIGMAGGIC